MTFATSGVTGTITSIDPPQETIGDIALPDLSLSRGSYLPYSPGDLIEGGEFSVSIVNDFDTIISVATETETVTWTKPLQDGDTVAANWSFPGYIKSVKEENYETEERGMITIVVKVAGEITKTPAS